ncbi:hypothetical protein AVME950_19260 [Acidovorax sp. SUPP950]|uniref:hypothetical protein n=1 Tax=Acidovorax sp. SUPP950 TaxID=511901 RepID=UPI0023C8176B|nr:hypothetical protein [Acidovorax sp. SUPP950]GKS77070.1 hypothetical protein AVME950_19260 [Acidovorax sp. SUPP950]
MTESNDPIANLAFTELIITCQADGCLNLFQKSLDEPATDPVEKWSVKMAGLARDAGWGSDAMGKVLCPVHANPAKIVDDSGRK